MRRPTYRKIQSIMIWAFACAGLGAASLAPHMFAGARPALSLQIVIAGSWAVALVLLVRVWFLARRLGRGIEDARTSVLNLVADRRAQLPAHGGPVAQARNGWVPYQVPSAAPRVGLERIPVR